MSSDPLRLGIIGSGKGSNYRAIQAAIDSGKLNARTCIVLTDVETAGIREIARKSNVPERFIPPGKFRTKFEPEIEAEYAEALHHAKIDLVVLAGFMRMLKAPLLTAFPRRIINIHPSLLPAFPGLEAWKQALLAGAPRTGCTVHYVDPGMDTGEIIAQREVEILLGDTPEALHSRIQAAEHSLYPEVIATFAERKANGSLL